MNYNKVTLEKVIFYSTLLIFFIIGLKSFQDYGISLDENYHRESGLLYYKFIKGFFFEETSQSITALDIKNLIATGNLHPVFNTIVFDLPIEFFIDLFNLNNSKEIFYLRHFATFFYFLIGIYFFFKLIKKRFNGNLYAYFGILFLFFSPRIFGESFYNNKDIFFLSLTIISLYFSIKFLITLQLNQHWFFLSSQLWPLIQE